MRYLGQRHHLTVPLDQRVSVETDELGAFISEHAEAVVVGDQVAGLHGGRIARGVLAMFALDMVKPADVGLMGSEEYKETSISGSEYVVDTETSATHLCDIK